MTQKTNNPLFLQKEKECRGKASASRVASQGVQHNQMLKNIERTCLLRLFLKETKQKVKLIAGDVPAHPTTEQGPLNVTLAAEVRFGNLLKDYLVRLSIRVFLIIDIRGVIN